MKILLEVALAFWSMYGKKTLTKDGGEMAIWLDYLKCSLWGFLSHHMEKPEWTHWPTQYDMEWWIIMRIAHPQSFEGRNTTEWLSVKMW